MTKGRDRGVEDSLETDLVATEGLNGLLEGKIISRGVSRDIELLPVNRDVSGLEDGLDSRGSLLTDTVTGNQGDSVATTELGEGDLRLLVATLEGIRLAQ